MAESAAQPRQLRFPEPDLNHSSSESSPQNPRGVIRQREEKEVIEIRSIPEGTEIRTGPIGGLGQFLGKAPDGARVRVRRWDESDGMKIAAVEFESPPEIAGKKTGWIAQDKSGKWI